MCVKAVSCEKRTRLGCFVSSWLELSQLELNRHLSYDQVSLFFLFYFASFEYVEVHTKFDREISGE